MFLVSLCKYWNKHSVPQTKYLYPTHKTANEKRLLTNKRARMKRRGLKANGHADTKGKKKTRKTTTSK